MAEMAAILPAIIGAGASVAASKMGAKTPKVQEPVKMPAPDDPAALEAKRRKQAELSASQGRESTNLTPQRSAAPAYTNTVLGGS